MDPGQGEARWTAQIEGSYSQRSFHTAQFNTHVANINLKDHSSLVQPCVPSVHHPDLTGVGGTPLPTFKAELKSTSTFRGRTLTCVAVVVAPSEDYRCHRWPGDIANSSACCLMLGVPREIVLRATWRTFHVRCTSGGVGQRRLIAPSAASLQGLLKQQQSQPPTLSRTHQSCCRDGTECVRRQHQITRRWNKGPVTAFIGKGDHNNNHNPFAPQ